MIGFVQNVHLKKNARLSVSKSKYEFDLPFQEFLLASLMSDVVFLRSHSAVLKPEYFDSEILGGIAEAALTFFDNHGKCPDYGSMCEEVKKVQAPGRKLGEYKDRLKRVFNRVGSNTKYYQQKACDFAKRQAVMGVLRNGMATLEAGPDGYDDVLGQLNEAMKIGRATGKANSYFGAIKKRAKAYQTKVDHKGRLTTGIPSLDMCTHGGLARGELAFIMAPPKRGKSTFLINIGVSSILAGRNVLHVSLEMREKTVAARYDSRFTGESLLNIQKRPKAFYQAMRKIRAHVDSRLHIIEFPTKGATVSDIRRTACEIDKLGAVIVDYADLVRPQRHRNERRFELSEVYEDLRRMAGELDVPVWTATQASRQALKSKHIGLEFISECFDKGAIVDLAMSMCQTYEEIRGDEARIYVMANRIGQGDVEVKCNVNWQTATITEVGDDEDLDD